MASFSMFGSLGAAVQVVLILYPLIPLSVSECVCVLSSDVHLSLTQPCSVICPECVMLTQSVTFMHKKFT